MNPLQMVRRILRGSAAPDGATGELHADEHVLAHAPLAGGGHLVATSHGLWLPEPDAPRFVGWHLVSKASWQGGSIVLVEAEEQERIGTAVVLADRAPRRLRLTEPGRVPQVVHQRVEGSIRTRNHRDLPSGGAWFVQRKVAGRDGFVLQVRPDPGTDPGELRQVTEGVARQLGGMDR